ncbi:MAG: ComEC/Rec2 family competence protein [Verrucomicrobia bacterium]|nr:MAG: ComEC/Rec2 family competence protein [Verrucomicrobiota bacterium]
MSTTPDTIVLLPEDELPLLPPRTPLRRPVAGLALAFCLGIGLGLEIPGTPLIVLATGGAFALLALLWRQRGIADFLLAASLACAGWAQATLVAHNPSAREITALLARPAEYVAVLGEIRDAPTGQRDDRTGEMIWTFPVRLEGLRRITHWQRAAGEIEGRIRVAGSVTPPQFGERWLLTGLLGPYQRWRAGGETPAGYRLAADFVASRRLAEAHASLYGLCLETRAACADLLGRGLEKFPEQTGLLRAMMLGTREDIGDALFRDFSVTGTLHIIAVSGTHVAVIALLLLAILRTAGLTQPYWFFGLAPLLTFYTLMTGLAPSAIRACIMALLFWIGPLLQRRPDGLLALAWSAILILAWDPTQWLDMGFILSYTAVLGLLLFYPPLAACVRRGLSADPWQLQAEARSRRWARATARYVILLAATSLAACLATTPITARYFNLISPVALLANLAVVPAAGLMMVLGCLTLVGGALWLPLAGIFNSANLLVITFITRCTEWSAVLPGGHFFVRSPGWPVIAVYYALLAAALLGGPRTRRGLVVGLVFLFGSFVWHAATDRNLAIHLWRLGDATVALVDAPGGDKLLVNTGPRILARDLLRRIHAEGVGQLRALVLTRGTTAQAGGACELLRQVPTRELWLTSGSAPPETQLCAQRQNVTERHLEAGQLFPLAGGAELEVFHPAHGLRTRRVEDRALIFRIARGPLAVLFLNDAGGGALAQLGARPAEPAASFVLAEKIEALPPASWARLATRAVITPASEHRETQEAQATLEHSGLRLWRMAEGTALHIRWPDDRYRARKTPITLDPSPTTPTTF